MKYRVNKSIVFQGVIFTPDKEYELTPDQITGLRKRGALEGDAAESEGQVNDAPQPSELETQLVEVLRPFVSETGESEGAVDVLNRLITERDQLKNERADIVEGARKSEEILRDQIADLQANLANETKNREAAEQAFLVAEADLKKVQSGSTPSDPFALVKLVGVEAVSSLLKVGFDSSEKIEAATDKQLEDLPGIGKATVEKIRALPKG